MSEIISKELLSEILNIENERISKKVHRFCFPTDNIIAVEYYMQDGWMHLNIHELTHKCKKWILINKYKIFIYSDDNSEWYCQVQLVDADEQPKEWSVAETEAAAVFAACQWILDNKDKK